MRLLAILAFTPSLTGFVLLGKNKAKLPATPESPEIEFIYDPNGEVPPLSSKDALLDGQYANLSDQELFPILLQIAVDQWNGVRGSYLRLKLVPATSTPERSRDDKLNVILAERNTNASTAAFATPENNPDNADEISDCDISVSLSGAKATSMLETLTHEIGHCVGLGHPHNNYGAIMSYSRGGSSYKLGADDKAGAIFLYPDPAYVDDKPKELIGCGNIGIEANVMYVTWMIVLLPLLALTRKYRFTIGTHTKFMGKPTRPQ
ncbi:MAG: M57 family metalloprotease [Proteobacteria bacterium]|nr:M57 family metalloprotease [Pseudomonadota bacterium]